MYALSTLQAISSFCTCSQFSLSPHFFWCSESKFFSLGILLGELIEDAMLTPEVKTITVTWVLTSDGDGASIWQRTVGQGRLAYHPEQESKSR